MKIERTDPKPRTLPLCYTPICLNSYAESWRKSYHNYTKLRVLFNLSAHLKLCYSGVWEEEVMMKELDRHLPEREEESRQYYVLSYLPFGDEGLKLFQGPLTRKNAQMVLANQKGTNVLLTAEEAWQTGYL